MFPLSNRKLIRGCQAHIKAGLGCGADYEAEYTPFQIPFTGQVETYAGPEGGNWLRLIRDDNGDRIELAHLSKYHIKSGHAQAGELGGITGNSGNITTGPHLHIQIINKAGRRLDPEAYEWNPMAQIKTQAKGASRRIVLEAADPNEWIVLTKVYGKDPNNPEEIVS